MSDGSTIDVRILRPPIDLGADWDALVDRASPNVFMDPAGINAAHATGFAEIRVLVARSHAGNDGSGSLLGVWALEEKRIGPLGFRYLAAIPHRYAVVASPVIDRDRAGDVTAAMLRAIAADARLPKVLFAGNLDDDPDFDAALATSAAIRRRIAFNRRARAFFTPNGGAKRSGSTRKKLRQDWNRLSALGAVAIANDEHPDAVRNAFEIFLAMEAASWKGAAGTALLSDPADARFARQMIAGYAKRGGASVALLTVAGRPIAAQVILKSGARAYTWKIAYDEAYQKYSPGSVLVDRLSELLAASGFAAIDSCSPEGGFMSTLWSGRQATVDIIAELGNRPTLAFPVLVAKTLARSYLKRRWHALRDAARRWRPIARPAAATPARSS